MGRKPDRGSDMRKERDGGRRAHMAAAAIMRVEVQHVAMVNAATGRDGAGPGGDKLLPRRM